MTDGIGAVVPGGVSVVEVVRSLVTAVVSVGPEVIAHDGMILRPPQRRDILISCHSEGAAAGTLSAVVVGRDELLEAVATRLASGGSACLHGEPGIGRTTLLGELARRDGGPILAGGGLASLAWSPYLPILRALRVPLPAGDHTLIATYVAHRVRDGILVLDDLQFADRDTLAVLEALAGRVRVLAAVRDGDPGSALALAAARSGRCEPVSVAALSDDATASLVRAVNPRAGELLIRDVVRVSGGNPWLAQEHARGGGGESTIAQLVDRRLASAPAPAATGAALLALLGRPAPRALVAEEAGALAESGLIEAEGDAVRLRHPVYGERALARAGAEARQELHLRLAAALADPGERARHLAAAGRPAEACAAALAAAEGCPRPVERAHHLGLAAACAQGSAAPALTIRAATALVSVGDAAAAIRLFTRVAVGDDDAPSAELDLVRARAALVIGEPDAAMDATTRALTRAEDGGLVLMLEVERLRAEAARGAVSPQLLTHAVELAEVCRLRGVADARAAAAMAAIALRAEDRRWRDAAERALQRAHVSAEFDVESDAARTLVLGHWLYGDAAAARAIAAEMQERCARRLLRRGELEFACHRLWFDLHADGAVETVARECRALLDGPVPGSLAGRLGSLLGLALADGGAPDAARRLLAELEGRAHADHGRLLSWTRAEVALLNGDPATAQTLAGSCARDPEAAYPVRPLAAVTAAWAARERAAGGDRTVNGEPPSEPFGGTEAELVALAALGRDPGTARDGFASAASRWGSVSRRGGLRCAWAEAESVRLLAQPEAVELLDGVREEMERAGIAAWLPWLNRSLRAAGVRHAAGPSADGHGLTAREREVLALVAAGETTATIARRLGLANSTVETHIESARDKLGGVSRVAAAILAAEPLLGQRV